MVTQILKTSLLMDQEDTLILRESDKGNQIQFSFNDLSTITSAEFRLIKPDETFVISTGEIDTEHNIITFEVSEQCCTVPGKGRFNIRLIGTDINVYTYVGRCIIDINLDLENAVESTAEANGYTFPDDFLTSADLSNYATKNYVDTAIENVPVYTPINYSLVEQKTGRKWIDGKDEYECSFVITNTNSIDISSLNIDKVTSSDAIMELPNGIFYHLNIYGDTSYNAFYETDIVNGDISVTIGSGWNPTSIHITLKYTKLS